MIGEELHAARVGLGDWKAEGRFESRRFRPNFVIETAPDAGSFPESDWEGKVLSIGHEVQIKITGPCGRCVMTTLEQDGLPKDIGILKTAAKHNQARVGAYASVVRGGRCGQRRHCADQAWLSRHYLSPEPSCKRPAAFMRSKTHSSIFRAPRPR